MLFVKRESYKRLSLNPLRHFEAYFLSLVNFLNLLFTISTCITKPKKIQARILILDVKKIKQSHQSITQPMDLKRPLYLVQSSHIQEHTYVGWP